jgi:hypothetical protein
MVGLNPDAAKDLADGPSAGSDEGPDEWEEGLIQELDDILEESIF